MNFSELKAAFSRYIDDVAQDDFTETDAGAFVNTALNVVAREVDLVDEKYFVKCAKFTVVASDTDQVFDLPADFNRVDIAEQLNGSDKPTPAEWVDFSKRDEFNIWPPHRLNDTVGPVCFLKGTQIGVVAPSDSFTLRLWYSHSPAALVDDDDIPTEIPLSSHDTIALQAAEIAANIEGKDFRLGKLLQRGINDISRTLTRRNRQQPRYVHYVE